MIPAAETRHIVEPLGCFGMLKFRSEDNDICFHADGHREGAGESGKVVIWNSSPLEGSGSAWFFRSVDPEDEIITGIGDLPADAVHKAEDTYSLDGRLIRRAADGRTGLAPGIYIAGRRKIMIR